MTLCADVSDSSFLLDYLSKAKIVPNFSAGNKFLFFNRFWNGIFFDSRCHFIEAVFLLEKSHRATFNFSHRFST